MTQPNDTSGGHEVDRHQRVVQRAARHHQHVEHLVVSEHTRERVRSAGGVNDATERVQDAAEHQQHERHDREPVASSVPATTPSHPALAYKVTLSAFGAPGQIIFSSTPAPAIPQITDSRLIPQASFRVSRQNGVYVPAISTKIIEWSRRFISERMRRPQRTRWYVALVA